MEKQQDRPPPPQPDDHDGLDQQLTPFPHYESEYPDVGHFDSDLIGDLFDQDFFFIPSTDQRQILDFRDLPIPDLESQIVCEAENDHLQQQARDPDSEFGTQILPGYAECRLNNELGGQVDFHAAPLDADSQIYLQYPMDNGGEHVIEDPNFFNLSIQFAEAIDLPVEQHQIGISDTAPPVDGRSREESIDPSHLLSSRNDVSERRGLDKGDIPESMSSKSTTTHSRIFNHASDLADQLHLTISPDPSSLGPQQALANMTLTPSRYRKKDAGYSTRPDERQYVPILPRLPEQRDRVEVSTHRCPRNSDVGCHLRSVDTSILPRQKQSSNTVNIERSTGSGIAETNAFFNCFRLQTIHETQPESEQRMKRERGKDSCLQCKLSRKKCSGGKPCDRCRKFLQAALQRRDESAPINRHLCLEFNLREYNVFSTYFGGYKTLGDSPATGIFLHLMPALRVFVPSFSGTFRPHQFTEARSKLATEIDKLERMNQSGHNYVLNSATEAMKIRLRTTELLASWQRIVKAETIRAGIEFLFTTPPAPRHCSFISQWMENLPTTRMTPSKVCPNYGKGKLPDSPWMLASGIIRGKEMQARLGMGLRIYADLVDVLARDVFDHTSVLLQRLHNKKISGAGVLLLASNLSTILFLSKNQYARTKLTESLLGADDFRTLMLLLDKQPGAQEAIQQIKDHQNADRAEIFQRLTAYTELQLDELAKHHDVEWIVLRTLFRLNTLCRLEKSENDKIVAEVSTELITRFQNAMSSVITSPPGKQQKMMDKVWSDFMSAAMRSGNWDSRSRCHCTQCLATINPEQALAIALRCRNQLRDSVTISQSGTGIISRVSQAKEPDPDKRTSAHAATYPVGENGQLRSLPKEWQLHSLRDAIEYARISQRMTRTEDAKSFRERMKTMIPLVLDKEKDCLRTLMHKTPSVIGPVKNDLMRLKRAKALGLVATVNMDALRELKDAASSATVELKCMREDRFECLEAWSKILKCGSFPDIDEGEDLLEMLRCNAFFTKAQVEYLLQVIEKFEETLEHIFRAVPNPKDQQGE